METLFRTEAIAEEIKPIADKWLLDVEQLTRDVKDQAITQLAWQEKTEELFSRVELGEFLRLIDFEKLTTNIKMVDNGARSLKFEFPKVEGLPKKLLFGKQVFALHKGRSVVPHGHNNMATAFFDIER